MHIHTADAIILHRLDYGEADRIVTFLTVEQGRLKGFARAARKSRRRFGGALEPFAQVRLFWTAPRSGELVSLREAELLDLRAGLRASIEAIALAGYGCELVEALLGDGQGHPEAFSLLRAFLDHLGGADNLPETRLLFELRLLRMAGYAPHLLHCSACGETLRQPEVAFAAGRGGSLCSACAPGGSLAVGLVTLGSLARLFSGPADRFAGVRLTSRTLEEGAAVLADSLRLHLGRPLRSLSFLERLKAPADDCGNG